jgi:erythromycin esterase-like protein
MKPGVLLSVLLLVASCTTAPTPAGDTGKTEERDWVVEFPPVSSLSSTDFDPVREAVGSRSIVMLGESMHLTSEFSRVRDMLIRNLHENADFNLLLFEGSPIEFWIAEEEYLTSRKDVLSGSDFQKTALVGHWQTEEIRSVIDYALRSQTGVGSSDLYLSSYDVQVGQGRRFVRSDRNVFESLVGLLKKRYKRLSKADEEGIVFLEGLVACKRKGFPDSDEQYSRAEEGIRTLSQVVARSAKSDSGDLHEKTLALLPKVAGYSLEFCREVKDSRRNYTEVRDEWASKQFADLFSTLNARTLVWAHSTHVRQSAGKDGQMSFGAYARSAFPDEIVAIHFTAGSGKAVAFTDAKGNEIEPMETALLPLDKVSMEEKLSGLSSSDFFVVSKNFPARFKGEETTRREPTGFVVVDPRKDFDAYYFVRETHTPQMR